MSKTTTEVGELLRLIEDLKFFLATAPANWQDNQVIRRYYLNLEEGFVLCVFWNNLYFITGTDIVRCIVYKLESFGRKIIDRKKFEEGIFSDLRNLKCGTDAILEPPRLDFLEFLFKNLCLRTQKKQKVFFWFSVPHDKLMADALERDLKKEKQGQKATTAASTEPALLFIYDENKQFYQQFQAFVAEKLQRTVSTPPVTDITKLPEFVHSHTTPPAVSIRDDDFPLDYFPSDPDHVINLDPNQAVAYGNLLDDNYDQWDLQMFFQSSISQPVVLTDEYLIEQAHPVKPMGPPPGVQPGVEYQVQPPPPPPPPPHHGYYQSSQFYYEQPGYPETGEYWGLQPAYEYPSGGYDEYLGAGYLVPSLPPPPHYPMARYRRQPQRAVMAGAIHKNLPQRPPTLGVRNYNLDEVISAKGTKVVVPKHEIND